MNYETFRPGHKQILERYLLKFSKGGKGKPHEDDLGLLDADGAKEATQSMAIRARTVSPERV
jgi:hypothetical protein